MRFSLKKDLQKLVCHYRSDYSLATALSSGASACLNLFYALFNGLFGLVQHSAWHIAVFFYYVLLLGIREHILISIRRKRAVRAVYIRTHALLLLMNLSMIGPAVIMIRGEREFTYGLIPAIAMAAYTTYRVSLAAFHLKRSHRAHSPLVKELRTIGFIDALVSVMTLQNTLIMANGGMDEGMISLCGWTNAGLISAMVLVTILSFSRVRQLSDSPPSQDSPSQATNIP